jgi:hypothetical protein
MTTAAECATFAPVVAAHAAKAQSAGSIPGHGTQLAQGAQILAGIGSGATTAAQTSSLVYTACATACAQAAMFARGSGDLQNAVAMVTAQKIFNNLAAGL